MVAPTNPHYPNIHVKLTGSSGNAFAVMGKVKRAMRRGGADQEDIDKFLDEATSGDYDHLLQTAMTWVDVV